MKEKFESKSKKRFLRGGAMKIHIKTLSIEDILLIFILFFVPYTAFRVMGFKISELLSMILIFFSFGKISHINKKEYESRFLICFSATILISGLMSLFDPINQYVRGSESGIYYSFEFGWLFRIIRIFIVYFFAQILKKNIEEKEYKRRIYFDVYICLTQRYWLI